MKLIIGYARLSTVEQGIGITLEQQIHRLKEAGAEEVYYDLESGRKDNRLKLNQLITEAKQGKVKKIICTRVDRFSRKASSTIKIVEELYSQYNVDFEFLDEPFLKNLEDPNTKMMLGMQAILAQRESDCISQRIKNGVRYKRFKGLPLNNKTSYGYSVNPITKSYILNKTPYLCLINSRDTAQGISEADIAREIIMNFFRLKSVAAALKEIHLKYGIPFKNSSAKDSIGLMSTGHAARWIRNPILRGHTAYTKEEILNQYSGSSRFDRGFTNLDDYTIVKDTHPTETLLSEGEFEIIDIILNSCAAGPVTGIKSKAYFNGIIFCEKCRKAMTTRHGEKYLYYFCRYSRADCPNNKSIREDELHRLIVQEVFHKSREMHSLEENLEKVNYSSDNLDRLQKKLDTILELLRDDPNDDTLLAARNNYIIQMSNERNYLNLPLEKVIDKTAIEIINHPALKNIGFIYPLSHDNRRIIYHKLINKIVISNGEVKSIQFNILL